jgi:DTW domain-containing protein YfiP
VGCYCAHVTELATRTRVVVLQHPRERVKAVGTARIAALCLPSSEVFVGVDFSAQPRLDPLLCDPARPAVLLYPGPDARDLAREPPPGPVTLVVVDGTWHHARTLMRRNPRLQELPRYVLSAPRPSEYRIRRAPRADYVSTLEALVHALTVLEGRHFEALLAPFRAMVSVQLGFAAQSSGGRKRERRREPSAERVSSRLPPALLAPSLLCVGAEANAWPYDRARGAQPHPHELVQWLALRPHEDAHFEALLAPRLPLARSPLVHARLDAAELRAGQSLGTFLAAWRSFLRPEDVICSWGVYGAQLLEREGATLPGPLLDLRKVAGDYLKRRPGSLEELVRELALPWQPRGRGRGGERLGMLAAATRFFATAARAQTSEAQSDLRV